MTHHLDPILHKVDEDHRLTIRLPISVYGDLRRFGFKHKRHLQTIILDAVVRYLDAEGPVLIDADIKKRKRRTTSKTNAPVRSAKA